MKKEIRQVEPEEFVGDAHDGEVVEALMNFDETDDEWNWPLIEMTWAEYELADRSKEMEENINKIIEPTGWKAKVNRDNYRVRFTKEGMDDIVIHPSQINNIEYYRFVDEDEID